VRPWIQAFTLGAPPYGPAEIEAQKRGIYAAGYDGWVLWHPGSKYEPFLPGLEKTLERRAKPYPPTAASSTPVAPTPPTTPTTPASAGSDSARTP
jgi:hypothetical protein